MIARKILILSGAFFFILTVTSTVRCEILGDFLSYSACIGCHAKIVTGWRATPHAQAFETLKIQGEEKQQNPGCLQCHVVGFDREGGFIDMELTPELKDVQCESCHGPGRRHTETMNPADILGKPGESTCRTCHTEGQDKAFDFETKSQTVHGREEALTEPVFRGCTIEIVLSPLFPTFNDK